MIYSEDTWKQWLSDNENFSDPRDSKRYIHFDHPFAVKQIGKLQSIFIRGNGLKNHDFLPLIKFVIKTPRYKYQENMEKYDLETKERPISFASHFDSKIYAYYAHALNTKYQDYIVSKGFSEVVLAYRSDLDGKSNIQFAKEAFDTVKARGQCTALALDIKGYFDSIDHTILKDQWSTILGGRLSEDDYAVYKSLTRYNYVNRISLLKHFSLKIRGKNAKHISSFSQVLQGKTFSEKMQSVRDARLITKNSSYDLLPDGKKRFFGVPQGSSLSALLSNIYLLKFDEDMWQMGKIMNFSYRRYCDDILIICNSDDASEIQKNVIDKISKEYHLIIQDKKVDIIKFANNSKGQIRAFNEKKRIEESIPSIDHTNEQRLYKALQYLGFEFTGQKVLIRGTSLSRYMRKMRARIVKSVGMAYGSSGSNDRVFKQQLLKRYTHLGNNNFLKYAYNASLKTYKVKKGTKKGFDSPAIRNQLSRHFDIILKSLALKNDKRFNFKKNNPKNRGLVAKKVHNRKLKK